MPTISVSPIFAALSSTTAITVTGVGTLWTSTTPTLTIVGVAGASLGAQTIVSDTVITTTVITGSTNGIAGISDPESGAICALAVGTAYSVTASNLFYIRGDADRYVSPIAVFARSDFVLTPSANLANLAYTVHASNQIVLRAATSSTASYAVVARNSITLAASSNSGRDLHVTASNSIVLTPWEKSNQFWNRSAANSFTVHATATRVHVSGSHARNDLIFTCLARAEVVYPWRRAILGRPPGGNLPH